MSLNVQMPKFGLTMKQGTVSKWFKGEGDVLEKGEELFEVETEKITNKIESPADGTLFQIVVPAGSIVPVGAILAIIAQNGEVPERIEGIQVSDVEEKEPSAESAAKTSSSHETDKRLLATPSAHRLAKELGVELSQVRGSGPGGRIKESDVKKFHEEGPPIPPITPLALEMAKKNGLDIATIQGTGENGRITKADVERAMAGPSVQPDGTDQTAAKPEVIPMTGMRLAIAKNMHASLQNTAQLTAFTEADVTEMVHFRNLIREEYRKQELKVSYNDIIMMVTARTLMRHPIMNSTQVGEEILLHDHVDLGMAVALKQGLIVPKIRNAERKNLLQIAAEARELASAAREGTLEMDAVTNGTFTITNVSMLGMDGFTPVLNPPETGILGVGRVTEKPVVKNGEICIRQMMTLSLTFDHRVVDGAPAMSFLRDLARSLEEPNLLLARI